MIADLIAKNRSYRRFEKDRISAETLRELINLARLSASAANIQPLKFMISADVKTNVKIFPCTSWAGYLKDFPGPDETERPTGYIIILGDTKITKSFDADCGIAAQSIMLGATELALGGCMIGSINREELRKNLNIPEHLEILLILALGKPKEKVIIEPMGADGDVKYWRDDQQIHHVPKRSLEDLIVNWKMNDPLI